MSILLMDSMWSENSFDHEDVEKCPFLRNIYETTQSPFSSVNFLVPVNLFSLLYDEYKQIEFLM